MTPDTLSNSRYILTLACGDVRGIVAAVSTFLRDHHGFILESAQFGDPSTNRFFMRVDFSTDHEKTLPPDQLMTAFDAQVGKPFSMNWQLHDTAHRSNVVILVSQHGHCLNDLLHRYSTGQLPINICAVISNHQTLQQVVEWHNIPFHHFPTAGADKLQQENNVRETIAGYQTEAVVLARYMQILSEEMCAELSGRAINIHHSFLPSFKGARPYHQAYTKGVKLIGATAHYVTTDLDEGPIIEQEVARVDHTHTPEALTAIGRDIECAVLARALKYHVERRVILNGSKTVVFR